MRYFREILLELVSRINAKFSQNKKILENVQKFCEITNANIFGEAKYKNFSIKIRERKPFWAINYCSYKTYSIIAATIEELKGLKVLPVMSQKFNP